MNSRRLESGQNEKPPLSGLCRLPPGSDMPGIASNTWVVTHHVPSAIRNTAALAGLLIVAPGE